MIKALILLLNLLGVFLTWLLFPGTVTVTQTAPSTAQINNSVLVQVTINKGDVTGSGKFTEQLPAGFKATAIDDEGAQTSFDGSTIEFSWSSLPKDGELNVSFRVDITSLAAAQNYALTGKFLYTANGQNSEADCVPSNITVTAGAAVQASSASQTNTPPARSSMPQTTTPQNNNPVQSSTPQISSSPQTSNTPVSSGGVFVVRQFSTTSISPKTDATVTLTIHKANISGFAKIEDSIPPGFTANPVDLKGASFTFVDTRAKFVWENIPPDSVVSISYRISAISNIPGTHIVIGNFSYLSNNNPNSISIGSTTFNSSVTPGYDINKEKNTPPPVNNNVVINTPPANSTGTSNQNASPTNTTTVVNTPPATNIASTPNTEVPSANNTNVTKTPPATESNSNVTPVTAAGITYKVQILAMHNPVGSSYFLNRKIKEHVSSESDGGLIKYTIGNYTDYKLVKEAKENLRSRGFEGAFVVTYKSGTRLSSEEAVKINH